MQGIRRLGCEEPRLAVSEKETAWVRAKKDGDYFVQPYVYQVVVGREWGQEYRVLSEHDDKYEAIRMQRFFINTNKSED